MKLRNLEMKDAKAMYEWMSEPDINRLMHFDARNVSIQSSKRFIESSETDKKNMHLAIVDENDDYLGTVSLKNIDSVNSNAEFAIAIRKRAMGKGISIQAMDAIFEIAFYKLNLNKVFLYVRTDNVRAVKFYEKYRLRYEGEFLQQYYINNEFKDIKWYAILKTEYSEWRTSNGFMK